MGFFLYKPLHFLDVLGWLFKNSTWNSTYTFEKSHLPFLQSLSFQDAVAVQQNSRPLSVHLPQKDTPDFILNLVSICLVSLFLNLFFKPEIFKHSYSRKWKWLQIKDFLHGIKSVRFSNVYNSNFTYYYI